MNGTLSALTIRLADSKRILTHGSAFADWFSQGRNAEALYALLALPGTHYLHLRMLREVAARRLRFRKMGLENREWFGHT